MTDIEDKLRRTLSLHLDPVAAPRSLPSRVRARAKRGRAMLIGASVLAATAAATAVAIAIPSLGRDTQDQAPVGPPKRSPADQRTPSPSSITPHKNGRIAYSLSTNSGVELHTIRPDGSGDQVIPTPPGLPWLHAWSPAGSKLAVSIFPTGGERTIWVMNADGSNDHQVAAADNVSVPSWSPDGTTIAYSASTDGRTEIHLVGADGTEHRIIHGEEADGTYAIFSAKFSPDGTKILFDRGTDSGFDIFVMNVDGSDVRRLTSTGTDYDPQWSPDGTKIAFTRQLGTTSDIFVMNADGSDVQRLTEGGDDSTNLYPQWAPDGTKIAYLAGITGGQGGLVIMNPDGSNPVELVGREVLGISWQPLRASGGS
jgi:Tol biopolymer transport system component